MPSLMATLGLDATQFNTNLNRSVSKGEEAGSQLSSALGSRIGGAVASFAGPVAAAAAAIGLVKEAFSKNMEYGDEAKQIQIGAERLGVSTDRYQDLSYAAQKTNTDISAVYAAYRKLAQGAVAAEGGDMKMTAALESFGISAREAKNLGVDELFKRATDNVHEYGLNLERTAALMNLMGKSADQLFPAMLRGDFKKADPFGDDKATIDKRAMFSKDVGFMKGVGKDMAEEFWTQWMMPDSVRGILHGTANLFRGAMGADIEEGGATVDAKTISKAELMADAKREKEQDAADKRAEALRKKLDNRKEDEALAALTPAERVSRLTSQISEMEGAIKGSALVSAFKNMRTGGANTTEEDRLEKENKLAELKADKRKEEKAILAADAAAEKKDIAADRKDNRFRAPDINSLQKIGAYVSPEMAGMQSAAQKSEQHLVEIRNAITEQNKVLQRTRF